MDLSLKTNINSAESVDFLQKFVFDSWKTSLLFFLIFSLNIWFVAKTTFFNIRTSVDRVMLWAKVTMCRDVMTFLMELKVHQLVILFQLIVFLPVLVD